MEAHGRINHPVWHTNKASTLLWVQLSEAVVIDDRWMTDSRWWWEDYLAAALEYADSVEC